MEVIEVNDQIADVCKLHCPNFESNQLHLTN